MSTNSWLLIALIAFLIFCCLPMFMSKRRGRPHDAVKKEEKKTGTPASSDDA